MWLFICFREVFLHNLMQILGEITDTVQLFSLPSFSLSLSLCFSYPLALSAPPHPPSRKVYLKLH